MCKIFSPSNGSPSSLLLVPIIATCFLFSVISVEMDHEFTNILLPFFQGRLKLWLNNSFWEKQKVCSDCYTQICRDNILKIMLTQLCCHCLYTSNSNNIPIKLLLDKLCSFITGKKLLFVHNYLLFCFKKSFTLIFFTKISKSDLEQIWF